MSTKEIDSFKNLFKKGNSDIVTHDKQFCIYKTKFIAET